MKIENVINLVAVAVIAAQYGRKQQLKKDIQEVKESFAEEFRNYKQPKYRTSYKKYADYKSGESPRYGAKSTNYELCVATREEGETVMAFMNEIIGTYGCASVGDLLETVGLQSDFLDDRIGWTSAKGMTLRHSAKYGYSLVFPNPTTLP